MDKFSEMFQQVNIYFSKMSSSQKLTLIMFIMTVSIVLVAITAGTMKTELDVLFRNLPQEEESAILQRLQSYGVKFEVKDGTIQIDKDDRDNVMMRLSIDKALPEKNSWGFLDMIKKGDSFVTTSEAKRQQYRIAVMKELETIISSLSNISSAKVIISAKTNNRVNFAPELEQRSAMVKVRVKGGQRMQDEEARGIADIVSGSVAGLAWGNVNVIDQNSHTYLKGDGTNVGGLSTNRLKQQLMKTRFIENNIRTVLGKAFARRSVDDIGISVNLELNMDKETVVSDRVNPDEVVVAHKKTEDNQTQNSTSGGETGANPNAGANDKGKSTTTDVSKNNKKDLKMDYTKIRSTVQKATGSIKTISVSVTLPYKRVLDEEKKEFVETPLSAEDLKNAEKLVLNAVGAPLTAANLTIIPVEYRPDLESVALAVPWWEVVSNNIPPWLKPVQVMLALILFMVVRRLFSVTKKTQETVEEELQEENQLSSAKNALEDDFEKDEKIKELETNLNAAVNEDIKKAASIVKRWAVTGS